MSGLRGINLNNRSVSSCQRGGGVEEWGGKDEEARSGHGSEERDCRVPAGRDRAAGGQIGRGNGVVEPNPAWGVVRRGPDGRQPPHPQHLQDGRIGGVGNLCKNCTGSKGRRPDNRAPNPILQSGCHHCRRVPGQFVCGDPIQKMGDGGVEGLSPARGGRQPAVEPAGGPGGPAAGEARGGDRRVGSSHTEAQRDRDTEKGEQIDRLTRSRGAAETVLATKDTKREKGRRKTTPPPNYQTIKLSNGQLFNHSTFQPVTESRRRGEGGRGARRVKKEAKEKAGGGLEERDKERKD